MPSRRSLAVLGLVVFSLVLVALTSRSLGDWSFDGAGYTHIPGARPKKMPPVNGEHKDDHGHGTTSSSGPADPKKHGLAATEDIPFRPHDPACDSFPDTSNLLVVMKTGATESYGKIPTQVMTMLRCLPDYFIFSDHDEVIAGHHIRDSLDTVLNSTKAGNKDFDLYERQRACAVDQESCNKLADGNNEGWNLDKYKNVHIAEKVYRLRPGYDWYLFIDADTYVLFPTLMQWLPRLDPSKSHYLGSVTMLSGYSFAHGGSGYLVSQPAMRALGAHPGIANELEPVMRRECCGDYVLGLSLEQTSDTRVRNMWPTINGEKPFTLPYGQNHWCHPLVTMHHMNAEEISTFYEWERARYPKDPGATPPVTRIRDVFEAFMRPRLVEMRVDWDNKAEDRFYLEQTQGGRQFADWELERQRYKSERWSEEEKVAHLSPEKCQAACRKLGGCFSWRWQDGLCGIGWSFKMGVPMRPTDVEKDRWTSGWNVDAINRFAEDNKDCGGVAWPEVP